MADEWRHALLRIFPRDDPSFADHAIAVFERAGGRERCRPDVLEAKLRERYPSSRVQVQERLGMNGDPAPHWYVYRDGRYRRSIHRP